MLLLNKKLFGFDITNSYFQNTIIIICILFGAYILSNILRTLLNRLVKLASETLMIDATRFNFFRNAVTFTIYTIAIIMICYTIPALQQIGNTLFAGASILAAIFGFASQQAFSNIVSGIFIVIFKPFRVGDSIKVGTDSGTIEDITLRHVVMKGAENQRIIIPNSVISNQTIINSTIVDEKVCISVDVVVDYKNSPEKIISLMNAIALAHESMLDNRDEEQKSENKPLVVTRIIQMTEMGMLIRTNVWAKDGGTAINMKSDLLKTIYEKFMEKGYSFAFAHNK
jgi:small conductance mechanosensitive channel